MISETTYARPVNGRRAKEVLIGRVHTTEAKERRIGYETASWYTLVSVPAGSYDVVLHDGRWALVRYAGTITDEHFVNRLGASSSLAPKRNIGKEQTCTAQLYPYDVARLFATDPSWELAEDWSIGTEPRNYHDGREYTAYSLIPPA